MKKTVLLVDDDPAILRVMRRALGQHDVCVLTATCSEEALRLADSVDLIVLDVTLDGECGVDVAAELAIRAPNARIVFTSGHTKEALETMGIEVGEARFVEKPLELEALERALSLFPISVA